MRMFLDFSGHTELLEDSKKQIKETLANIGKRVCTDSRIAAAKNISLKIIIVKPLFSSR